MKVTIKITERINKKIIKHIKKGLYRRGFTKRELSKHLLLDGAYRDFMHKLTTD